jgi:hypothetical protein
MREPTLAAPLVYPRQSTAARQAHDAASFYLRRDDVRSFTSATRSQMMADLYRRPDAVGRPSQPAAGSGGGGLCTGGVSWHWCPHDR